MTQAQQLREKIRTQADAAAYDQRQWGLCHAGVLKEQKLRRPGWEVRRGQHMRGQIYWTKKQNGHLEAKKRFELELNRLLGQRGLPPISRVAPSAPRRQPVPTVHGPKLAIPDAYRSTAIRPGNARTLAGHYRSLLDNNKIALAVLPREKTFFEDRHRRALAMLRSVNSAASTAQIREEIRRRHAARIAAIEEQLRQARARFQAARAARNYAMSTNINNQIEQLQRQVTVVQAQQVQEEQKAGVALPTAPEQYVAEKEGGSGYKASYSPEGDGGGTSSSAPDAPTPDAAPDASADGTPSADASDGAAKDDKSGQDTSEAPVPWYKRKLVLGGIALGVVAAALVAGGKKGKKGHGAQPAVHHASAHA